MMPGIDALPLDARDGALSPDQQFMNLLSDPYSAQLAASSIWIALGTSIGSLVLITLLFSLMRPRNTVVYAPKLKYADKKHTPPPIGNGFFAWFSPVVKASEEIIVDKVGLDAAVFLRFTKMCRNIFLVLTVFGCGILIPTHIALSDQTIIPPSLPGAPENEQVARAFQKLTPQYVRGSPMWAHVVCSWIFDFVIIYFLWRNYRIVTNLKRAYFESPEYQQSLHSRSILLTDVPPADRSAEGILRIANAAEQTATIPRAAIARNVKELPDLIKEHDETVRKLESVLAKYLKNPDSLPANRPTVKPSKKDRHADQSIKVDAIDYLSARIQELETKIKHVRESIDKRNPMPYGFATYNNIEDAHLVAYAARNKHPLGATVRLAPKPNDLIWENLHLTKKVRASKRLMSNLWIALLTFVWIAPNALIAIFLVSLSNLASLWKAFATTFNGYPEQWAIVQAIAAPAITSGVYVVLPIIFRRLAIQAGDLTKTARERHVTQKLYAFFVFNNLIVFSTFSALFKFIATIIQSRRDNPGESVWDAFTNAHLATQIMIVLCNVSPFWITWLLQRNLGSAIDLAQVVNLFWVWFSRTFMAPTPRQNIEWTAPPPFDYASYYNYFLFYATVTLCYATLQPLVLPVTFIFFAVDTWLKKYLILYIFITKTESGGQFWKILFDRVLFATFLANCIAALVIMGAQGTYTMLGCMAPLPLIVLGFRFYCTITYEDQGKYYNKAVLNDPAPAGDNSNKARRHDKVGVKFGHPALFKPLITPMVHAKAQHVLANIYRGRLESVSAADYSEIAMNPMSNSQPGKSAQLTGGDGLSKMFEVVPESAQDFQYFKDRADFGDEHGGGGELYGRPVDLVSERSHTPASFRTDYKDGGRSRSESPAPMPFRQQHNNELQYQPTYDVQGDLAPRQLYNLANESDKRLLSDPQLVGTSPKGQTHGGYVGVPATEDGEKIDYDAYGARKS